MVVINSQNITKGPKWFIVEDNLASDLVDKVCVPKSEEGPGDQEMENSHNSKSSNHGKSRDEKLP